MAQWTEGTIPVDGLGVVSAQVSKAPGPGMPALVLTHGAGGDTDEATLASLHLRVVEELRWSAVRFRFPYRDAGKKRPDRPAVLEATWRAVVDWARSDAGLAASHLAAGGRSMGGRIASMVAAAGAPVDACVFLAYPLHPSGNREKTRTAHLADIPCPMLFVAGDRDSLSHLDLLEPVVERLGAGAALHVVAEGDHSFRVRKSSGRTTADAHAEVVDTVLDWLAARGW